MEQTNDRAEHSQPEESISPETNLSESELEEVAGGMQNQLNLNQAEVHPGGVNKKLGEGKAKVPIRCNAFEKLD